MRANGEIITETSVRSVVSACGCLIHGLKISYSRGSVIIYTHKSFGGRATSSCPAPNCDTQTYIAADIGADRGIAEALSRIPDVWLSNEG
jgi:hypothetical protein